MWFDLDKPKVKHAVISLAVSGCDSFFYSTFLGGSSPETGLVASLLIGTPILVPLPLGAIGFVTPHQQPF